ncbi:MAG: ATP-binding cassette domain-containing protein [Candidatus Tectomicrobia bacterium]|nr:ATP-binding cassette domain-containing protein [Candidatus Tectomicrobia bacterium]
MNSPSPPVVEAKGLLKRFGPLTAVDGIDFEVRPGECFGFLGPNGAGKTSTMKMIYCASPVTEGALCVLGMDVRVFAREIKRRLGVVPQETNLDPDLSVRRNLLTYARYFGLPRAAAQERADRLLEFLELSGRAKSKIDDLSGGMKRRLLIARALIHQPELLVLDEPTTGLDPQARHLIWQRLRRLQREGVTLLLTTHYMEEAAQLCDRIVVMDQGKVLIQGNPRELVEREVGREVVELHLPEGEEEAPALRQALARVPGNHFRTERSGDTLYIYTERALEIVGRLKQAGMSRLFYRPATLEDLFLKLTGRGLRE